MSTTTHCIKERIIERAQKANMNSPRPSKKPQRKKCTPYSKPKGCSYFTSVCRPFPVESFQFPLLNHKYPIIAALLRIVTSPRLNGVHFCCIGWCRDSRARLTTSDDPLYGHLYTYMCTYTHLNQIPIYKRYICIYMRIYVYICVYRRICRVI